MKKDRVKQILEAALKLPPAKARGVVSALQAKSGAKADASAEKYLQDAEDAMAAAMEMAALTTLKNFPSS